jgi:beta-glucosidase
MPGSAAFPEGFLWGTATAAYQVEGAVREGGRTPSIWDTFSHAPGRTLNGDNGDVTCAHYEHLDQDLDLIAGLGRSAYRFSVSWPRAQPDGKGPGNQYGLDFYRRLVDGLLARGVVPVATLYHWDLPQALEDAGGWTVRDTAERFGEYTEVVVEALGDGVAMWITLNEPWCAAWLGYGTGEHAPGYTDVGKGLLATHHMLLAHARSTEVLRRSTKAPVGISLNIAPMVPATSHEVDIGAAKRADGFQNRLFLDPLFKGAYPADMVEHYSRYKPGLGAAMDGDLDDISRPIDFLGINYYSSNVMADVGRLEAAKRAGYLVGQPATEGANADLRAVRVGRVHAPRTGALWEVDPAGLTALLMRVRDDYTALPLYITENGSAENDYAGPDGAVHDGGRIWYLEQHIAAAHAALQSGVDLRGYFVWSLLDNFEWAKGFSMRFGLVFVDYPTAKRTPKDSYRWYRDVIAANGLP